MSEPSNRTFCKKERIVSRKLIETLFQGGCSRSKVAFPLRIVYMEKERKEGDEPVQVLVSVSKRHFKKAVDRNRVKRQVREAYRRNKYALVDTVKRIEGLSLPVVFIWLSDSIVDSRLINDRMEVLLRGVSEKLAARHCRIAETDNG
ncbi:ribonuclease P protein component [Xylanibacter muris]|uniref:Ribonuclease P protein component n=1 Tax=Xylanibacter muris TaxID=2736290 RepID=A0ABX2AIY9_9BACT|nr:ribonuclease P protein component [Xylanibacter muris]NPD91054.1 ribonuclease P protein component [Xylanibacter muris]